MMKSNWISVKDRLPEHQSNVLTYDGNIKRLCFYVKKHSEEFYCDDDKCDHFDYHELKDRLYWKEGWYEDLEQFEGNYDSYWIVRDVTHWMPLPEPPKK